MDALNLLVLEHDQHRRLFTQEQNFSVLRSQLIHHVNIEEEVLYPVLLHAQILEEEINTAWKDHTTLMRTLKELDTLVPHDEQWTVKFLALRELHFEHMKDEEENLFPEIRRRLSPDMMKKMKTRLETQKTALTSDEILYPPTPGQHETPPGQ